MTKTATTQSNQQPALMPPFGEPYLGGPTEMMPLSLAYAADEMNARIALLEEETKALAQEHNDRFALLKKCYDDVADGMSWLYFVLSLSCNINNLPLSRPVRDLFSLSLILLALALVPKNPKKRSAPKDKPPSASAGAASNLGSSTAVSRQYCNVLFLSLSIISNLLFHSSTQHSNRRRSREIIELKAPTAI